MARSGLARGFVRGVSPTEYGGSPRTTRYRATPHVNNRGDACLAQALPESAELVRAGQSWVAIGNAGTPDLFFPPSSTALMKCWNIAPNGGRSIVVDAVAVRMSLAPTTPVATILNIAVAIRAYPNPGAGSNTPASGLTFVNVVSQSGRKRYNGIAAIACASQINSHLSSTDWHEVGSIISANTAILNLQKYIPLYGRYVIPPGGLFAINACLALGTESGSSAFATLWFHEVQLDNASGMDRPYY